MPPKRPTDEDELLSGPQVARKAIPKSMQTNAGKEDPLSKRIFFYLSGRAFVSGANLFFIILVLGVIFSVLVTIKGFLCPDVATQQQYLPSYCPQKAASKQEL